MDYVIEKEWDGRAVLDVIRRRLGISHALLKHLKFIQNGITLNGSHVTVRAIVREGDTLTLATEDTESPEKLTPTELALDIAYEDDDVVVPSKPADMPTHQSFGHYGDTVANALAYRYKDGDIPFVFRPVNRLDRNTSGLLLIARNRIAAGYLSEAMKEHKISKKYLAVLKGRLPQKSGVIDTYMRRTAESVIVREVCADGEGGDRAITEYSVMFESDTHTLVKATPVTGRTHQLRVHFASLGALIEGDDMYGEVSEHIERHALHAARLSFSHPVGKGSIDLFSPLPRDMEELIDRLFSKEDASATREKLWQKGD